MEEVTPKLTLSWLVASLVFGSITAVCDSMSSNLPLESQSDENKCSVSSSVLEEVSTTPEGKDLKERFLKR